MKFYDNNIAIGAVTASVWVTPKATGSEQLEAQHLDVLGRALKRWSRYNLTAIDEVGYLPMAEFGAEYLFQVMILRGQTAGDARPRAKESVSGQGLHPGTTPHKGP